MKEKRMKIYMFKCKEAMTGQYVLIDILAKNYEKAEKKITTLKEYKVIQYMGWSYESNN